jgi:hypothetical protein
MREIEIRQFGYDYGISHLDILDRETVNAIQTRDLINAQAGVSEWAFYWFDCGVVKAMIENHLY